MLHHCHTERSIGVWSSLHRYIVWSVSYQKKDGMTNDEDLERELFASRSSFIYNLVIFRFAVSRNLRYLVLMPGCSHLYTDVCRKGQCLSANVSHCVIADPYNRDDKKVFDVLGHHTMYASSYTLSEKCYLLFTEWSLRKKHSDLVLLLICATLTICDQPTAWSIALMLVYC